MLIKYFLGIWNKSMGKKFLLADLEVIGGADHPSRQFYIARK